MLYRSGTKKAGELTYGSAGIGGFGHMSAELFGSVITGGSPEYFHTVLKTDLGKFAKLVKAAGIKPEQ